MSKKTPLSSSMLTVKNIVEAREVIRQWEVSEGYSNELVKVLMCEYDVKNLLVETRDRLLNFDCKKIVLQKTDFVEETEKLYKFDKWVLDKMLMAIQDEHCAVEVLDLSVLELRNKQANLLADALQNNHSIKELDVSGNQIFSSWLVKLVESLQLNWSNATKIKVDGNFIDYKNRVCKELMKQTKDIKIVWIKKQKQDRFCHIWSKWK